jgi:tRNA dimethylallyltransferase
MPTEMPHLIVLSGPTASGKTALAIKLAKHYRTVIVSADSRQLYREMQIGTAKPEAAELEQAPHYFIGSHSIADPCSAGAFEREALALLEELFQKHQVVVLTGGTGLYLQAVCQGLNHFPAVPKEVSEAVEQLYRRKGLNALQEELKQSDPAYYEAVDLQNPHRLIRALSVCRSSGKPFSSFRQSGASKRFFHPIFLQLHWPRRALYRRISQRVDAMLEAGLEAEARALFPQRHLAALQTVGYQELFDYFEGRVSRAQAIELIKRNSRRYAKRQLTWFRRDGHWKLFRPQEWRLVLRYIEQCRARGLALAQSKAEQGHWQELRLLERERTLALAQRYLHKRGSFSFCEQWPTDHDLDWIIAHQLSLLAEEKEGSSAYWAAAQAPPPECYWQETAAEQLPDWAEQAWEEARAKLHAARLYRHCPEPATNNGSQ